MERLRRRPEPAAIDITWVSCRGVKSSLPFHTPCLYASIFVVSSNNSKNRRRHRVKTPTDRAGGENPEWDAPLRLYLPDATSPESEAAGGKNNKKDVLLVRFEIKAEVAVLGDVHTASAAVPVPDLVADGRTRRVSYQLVGPDGRQPNGVVSFSYAFHERNEDDECQSSSDGSEPATPPCRPTPALSSTAVAVPPPRLYPAIEWTLLAEQPPVYPPVTVTAKNFTIAETTHYHYPPAPTTPAPPVKLASVYPPVDPASIYPPVLSETSFRSVYPTVVEPAKATALYPTVDLAPVSYHYPPAPGWGDRCLYS